MRRAARHNENATSLHALADCLDAWAIKCAEDSSEINTYWLLESFRQADEYYFQITGKHLPKD
jgi:hypothetical protein